MDTTETVYQTKIAVLMKHISDRRKTLQNGGITKNQPSFVTTELDTNEKVRMLIEADRTGDAVRVAEKLGKDSYIYKLVFEINALRMK
jgi:hypothetical protein